MMNVEDRYKQDAAFAQVVNALENMIRTFKLTPTEIREAAMYAAYRFEMGSPRVTQSGYGDSIEQMKQAKKHRDAVDRAFDDT